MKLCLSNINSEKNLYIRLHLPLTYNGENDSLQDSILADRPLLSKPVIKEDKVLLGKFISLLPEITVGRVIIVRANSVVSKSLPAYVIAVTTLAKPIKKFNFQTQRWEKIKD